jgi:hypothetical protein
MNKVLGLLVTAGVVTVGVLGTQYLWKKYVIPSTMVEPGSV